MRNGESPFVAPRMRSAGGFAAAILAVLSILLDAGVARAQGVGDLAVAPTRLIFEGRTRSAQISLLNQGTQPAVYRISIINMQMTDAGEYRRVEESGRELGYAESLVRYAPRQVELEPGESQTVRVLLRKPGDLKAGEYRSHILFQAVPDPESGQSIEMVTKDEGLSIRLIVVPGITIPLIVRHGQLSASASLGGFEILSGAGSHEGPSLSFQINRAGNRSVFGHIKVTYRTDGGAEYVIGEISQLAVYTPNGHRKVVLRLRVPEQVRLSGGQLFVSYRARPEDGGNILADAQVRVP